jgi:hypothetical protein
MNVFDLGAPVPYTLQGTTPTMLLAGDIDGDHRPDAITVGSNYVNFFHNDGLGNLVNQHAFPCTQSVLCAALCDANRDGRSDLVIGGANDNKIKFYRSIGTSLVLDGSLSFGLKPSSIGVADFNHDGWDDLAVSWRDINKVTVLFNNGIHMAHLADRYDLHATIGVGLAPIQVLTGAVNHDPFPDMIVVNRDSQTLSVFINKGDGTFYKRPEVALEGKPLNLAMADFDHDGNGDLALIIAATNKVLLRMGDGNGGFGDAVYFDTGGGPRSVTINDLDRDGFLDIVTSNWGNDAVTVLLNNQTGGFNFFKDIHTGFDPTCSVIVDLNGDGDEDLMTVNRGSRTVSTAFNLWTQ